MRFRSFPCTPLPEQAEFPHTKDRAAVQKKFAVQGFALACSSWTAGLAAMMSAMNMYSSNQTNIHETIVTDIGMKYL
jgi:hypothetical protein